MKLIDHLSYIHDELTTAKSSAVPYSATYYEINNAIVAIDNAIKNEEI